MRELVITANEAGQRFDKYLRKYLKEMPLSGIYKSIRKKEITVNGNKASEKYL
ncbi:MAG TPA: RluA family pseudouridine synthase, partial [Clostridiaceae bacterium]|nr:RluA family pseudouridine synthase [Clostridiaceae bacterium]